MSSSSSSSEAGPSGRRLVAEMPVYLSQAHRDRQKAPQKKIDEFWKKFTTKAPGKATTLLPKNELTSRLARRATVHPSHPAQASFAEAAALCYSKVNKIIEECRRVNQKYRDPHFDLEFDLKTGRRDCLESLDNTKEESSSDDSDSDSSRSRSSRRHRRRRRHRDAGDGAVAGEAGVRRPHGRAPGSRFAPKSVKRVGEIFDDPKFYIDGPTANDVRQGRDGDCWLMAALCTLSNKPGLIEKLCVHHDPDVGVYGFVFHRDGEWFSEIIDDKLYLTKPDYDEAISDRLNIERLLWDDGRERPDSEEIYRKTYQSNSGALYFAQCENPNETWLPLLEKAYAKAHGDYASIEGGFTGEGIEDLTGGVTSELFTTDILDKESFWKNELMQVNKTFLFGCSTGLWGRGWGDRKGIVEQHAYSVMRAVEMDGERLLLLKNPWGKSEWKGPWSDGSKEWTPEWLRKLDHRFGDDGAFWISYKELLRKYQNFDRTRLFGPDWKVTSIWTTLSVPWTIEYHETKFAFSLAKPGPVVIVLSQLDDRYFRGLEGKYEFSLAFRVHKAGQDDYLVRTQGSYRMRRSVNVELNLEAGEYLVLVKIDAIRYDDVMPPEDVMRKHAKTSREKLLRIGLAYDLAHAKAKIVETAEERAAREAYEKRKREKMRDRLKKAIIKDKERAHYFDQKRVITQRRKIRRANERQKAKAEKREAEARKREEERHRAEVEEAERREAEYRKQAEHEGDETKQGDTTEPKIEAEESQRTEKPGPAADDKLADLEAPEPETSTDAGEHTPPTSASATTGSEASTGQDKTPTAGQRGPEDSPAEPRILESQSSFHTSLEALPENAERPATTADADKDPRGPEPALIGGPESIKPDGPDPAVMNNPEVKSEPQERPTSADKAGADQSRPPLHPEIEGKVRAIVHTLESWEPFKEELKALLNDQSVPPRGRHPDDDRHDDRHHSPNPYLYPDADLDHRDREESRPRSAQTHHRFHSQQERYHHSQHQHHHQHHHPPPPPPPQQYRPSSRMPPMMGRIPPPPPPRGDRSDVDSLHNPDNDIASVASISDLSDRELDYVFEERLRLDSLPNPRPNAPPPMIGRQPHEDDTEKDPWNAVAVVGLRVYYQFAEGDGDKEIVKLRVIRPNLYELDEEEGEDGLKKKDAEGGEEKKEELGEEEANVLDLDDSAKDATVIG
ncbi:calcium-dependent cysteine-type endopeptidase [Podospora aff. communis PSN243]|uniref:Calcium-dependent cysteine-type endopeptidase n=1 Tax=Podospora aff. communis PSN243 TaxID=3040156 RepID=A0AAV9GXC1_9PEZI|nr:calcium-dependent cysteine-type endopeptidase [Podospora aff. communis PSN243]